MYTALLGNFFENSIRRIFLLPHSAGKFCKYGTTSTEYKGKLINLITLEFKPLVYQKMFKT